ERRGSAFERGNALLERVLRGIHDARVDVAELAQRKQIRGVRRVVEDVRAGPVDRDRSRVRRGVRLRAGMDTLSFELHANLHKQAKQQIGSIASAAASSWFSGAADPRASSAA